MIMEVQNYIDGTQTQADKKWPYLQSSTKAWVYAVAKMEYVAYIEKHGILPIGPEKQVVIDRVSEKLKTRGIKIHINELSYRIGWYINILNGKTALSGDGKIL